MSTLIDSDFVALHSQHTLQCADWLEVYALAKEEGIGECLDSYDFEDFLGLAVYLFITTQSQSTRQQLSSLFPKLGSAIVLPLLKILCKEAVFVERNIPLLARQSLNSMAPYALVIGINQVLGTNIQDDLKAVALQSLRQRLQTCEPPVCLVLSQLLSEANRKLVSELSVSQPFKPMPSMARRQYKQGSDVAVLKRRAVQCM